MLNSIKQAEDAPISVHRDELTPHVVEDPDLLRWDEAILTPPVRPSGTIKVRLEFAGRERPPIVADPAFR